MWKICDTNSPVHCSAAIIMITGSRNKFWWRGWQENLVSLLEFRLEDFFYILDIKRNVQIKCPLNKNAASIDKNIFF